MAIFEDVSSLLRFAKEWYQAKPGTQIPLDVWRERVHSIEEIDTPWAIYDGERGVERTPARLIPALAGLSLGLGTEALHAILDHHSALATDLCGCSFSSLHEIKDKTSTSHFTAWNTNQALLRAFCLNSEATARFMDGTDSVYCSPEFNVALLTIPNPDVWPVSSIRKHIQTGKTWTENVGHSGVRPTFLNSFRAADTDFDLLSDEQVLTLLHRSGNLCPDANSEYGIYHDFFCQLFRLHRKDGNLARIVRAINSAQDPHLIEQMRVRIFDNLCNAAHPDNQDGLPVLMSMLNLDEKKYGEMLDSIVLTINMLPKKIIKDASAYVDPTTPSFMDDFCKTPEKILLRLQGELLAVPPDSFKIQHFTAIGRFSSYVKHEQDFSGVDVQSLIMHCLDAMELYWATPHIDLRGDLCAGNLMLMLENIDAFVSYALKHFEPDYKRFEHLSQRVQVRLAKLGMDMRKLPGLTRNDRGEILGTQLGL